MLKNTFSIIVVFNPILNQLNKLIENLKKQTTHIIICNNSDFDLHLPYENVTIFNLKENLGIAKAQNVGMEWAFENGADFVLQMDQDSFPDEHMVENLLHSYYHLQNSGHQIGLIGPQDFDEKTLMPSKSMLTEQNKTNFENIFKVETVISSGSLIPKSTFYLVGNMNDRLFIDLVDNEYCWRINHLKLSVFKNIEAKLYHRLGEGVKPVTSSLTFCICSPFRHYYVFRNSIYLLKKGFVPRKWKYKVVIKLLITLVLTPFVFDKIFTRYRFMFKGTLHGILGRLGKL